MTIRDEFDLYKKNTDFKKMIDKQYVEFLDFIKNEKEDKHFHKLENIAKIHWEKVKLDETEDEVQAQVLANAELWLKELSINFEIKNLREALLASRKKEADDWFWFLILFVILPEIRRRADELSIIEYHNHYSNKIQESLTDSSPPPPPAQPGIGMGI